MAIQNRRGAYADFNPAKMVEGEFAVVKTGDPNTNDGDSVYISTATGTAKRVALYQDIVQEVESATTEVAQDLVQQINEGVAENVERAETAASNASDSATAAENSAQEAEETLNSKANVDGYYANMTVGTAEQLVSSVGIEDKIPYVFRTAGGSVDIGDREDDTLIGGSFGWNQLADSISTTGTHMVEGWASTVEHREKTLLITSTRAYTSMGVPICFDPVIVNTHKYLYLVHAISASFSINSAACNMFSAWSSRSNQHIAYYFGNGYYGGIANATDNGTVGQPQRAMISFYGSVSEGSTLEIGFPIIVDLTAMFGTTIADYIYSLEQATAGAGVAWFRKYFPKPYYAYNAGSLESVQVSAHNTTGLNQWDEEWENCYYNEGSAGQKTANASSLGCKNHIPVVPSTTYSMTCPAGKRFYVLFYDGSKTYISYVYHTDAANVPWLFTTPSNCCYITFYSYNSYGTTYNNDICINIHWDGERDGEYEPYVKRTYPIDSSVTLRGPLKLDENNHLYYDGDVYKSDGTIRRRYGIVDLGTLNYTRIAMSNSGGYFFASSNNSIPDIKKLSNSVKYNIVTPRYVVDTSYNVYAGLSLDKSIGGNDGGFVRIRDDAYTDAATFKAAMSGTYLVYEKATETIEQAEPFTNPQVVDDWGTEEYVDAGDRDVAIPVGHDTYYMANLKAKLEMAPDSPDGNGDYIVRQTDSHNAYVPLAETSAIQHLQETKANIDGYYDEMTVGNAEQILSTVGIEDQTPVTFRPSGGSADIGDRAQVKAIVGGSVAWNQLVNDGNFSAGTYAWSTGAGTLSASDGVLTFAPTNFTDSVAVQGSVLGTVNGHKYIFGVDIKYNNHLPSTTMFVGSGGYDGVMKPVTSLNTWVKVIGIVARGTGGNDRIAIYPRTAGWSSGDTVSFKNVICIDLTRMFGSTIADYLYNLETGTAGAGIAKLRSWGFLQKPYYEYNAGGLESVQTSGRVVRGFNAWDEEWELGQISSADGQNYSATSTIRTKNYIPVLPNTTYYNKVSGWGTQSNLRARFYDADKKYIGYNAKSGQVQKNSTFTTPDDCRFMRFEFPSDYGTTYNHDVCINLHWDGERDGEYEEYTERTYPLDPVVLRGPLKLDANNNLYYDGDYYLPSGTTRRRCGIVDLGTLPWNLNNHPTYGQYFYAYTETLGIKRAGEFSSTKYPSVCSKYVVASRNVESFVDKTYCFDGHAGGVTQIQIKDSAYTDITSFAASLSGVYVVYEKIEETTETAEPYRELQWIDDWGTEEYTDAGDRDFAMPVGQDVVYQPNLRAKLEMSPNSPDSNGDYVVRHNNGMNEYVELVRELPAAPSSNGTYVLKVTVSGGTATYTWEAQS